MVGVRRAAVSAIEPRRAHPLSARNLPHGEPARRWCVLVWNQATTCNARPLDQFSFPSGHTLHAVVFATVAIADYPQLAFLPIPFAFLVALSRMVAGLHYPSDVLAGAAIGAAIADISLVL